MKIGIEAQRIFRHNKHGMDFVALELIKTLQRNDLLNEYFIFVRPGADSRCLTESSNVHIIEVQGISYPFWEQVALPLAVKKNGVQLLHCTSNTAPLFSPVPLIITLHDIIYLEKNKDFMSNPNLYQRLGRLYRKLLVPPALKKANQIITVSQFEKKTILENVKNLKDKVAVVYNGVGNHFTPKIDLSTAGRIRARYNLPANFILFLGNTDPKKNTKNVLKAYSLYRKQVSAPLPLVIVDFNKKYLHALLLQLKDTDLADSIFVPGYIYNGDLPILYHMSSLFLYPSLRESFGIPILEAMACGTPVLTSDTTSMPEVADGAAELVSPDDPAAIARGITEVLTSEMRKDELIQKGFKRSALFTWNKAAAKTESIYYKAIKSPERR